MSVELILLIVVSILGVVAFILSGLILYSTLNFKEDNMNGSRSLSAKNIQEEGTSTLNSLKLSKTLTSSNKIVVGGEITNGQMEWKEDELKNLNLVNVRQGHFGSITSSNITSVLGTAYFSGSNGSNVSDGATTTLTKDTKEIYINFFSDSSNGLFSSNEDVFIFENEASESVIRASKTGSGGTGIKYLGEKSQVKCDGYILVGGATSNITVTLSVFVNSIAILSNDYRLQFGTSNQVLSLNFSLFHELKKDDVVRISLSVTQFGVDTISGFPLNTATLRVSSFGLNCIHV